MKVIKAPVHVAVLAAVLGLNACGGGRNSGGGSPIINNGTPIQQYTLGTAVLVPVSLEGSSGVVGLPVTVTSSDTKTATVSSGTCFLSSSGSGRSCQVIVRGVAAGTVTLTASADGYPDASISASFGGLPPLKYNNGSPLAKVDGGAALAQYNYGSVQIGSFPSATPPSTTSFSMTAQLGQVVTLQTSLTGFDRSLDGVPILLQTTAGTFIGNPQCNVDSSADPHHYCIYQLQLPDTAPAGNTVTVTAKVVGIPSGFQTWNTPTVAIATTSGPVTGTIALESLDGSAPQGMSTPLWAILQDSSGVGAAVVTLQPSNSNITINPRIAAASGAYQTLSCTLSSVSPVCGFGVKGVGLGNTTVNATSAPSYTIQSLPLVVNAPLTDSRVIKFTNTSSVPVWVGITSGTSNSYETSASISTIDPATSGPNKMCGPSNPAGGCPRGTTCQQGGAYPSATTTYFCYWDQPVPSNGYEIVAGSTDTTSISISGSSYDPMADITWSGNFYAREGCRLSAGGELICAIADCGNASSGQACAPGTGGAPAVATLPEVTLQRNNTDYYDISIIGGANVATSFGPDSSAASADNPIPAASNYSCGTAGTAQQQGSLPAADWDMATHINEPLVAGGSIPYSETAQTAATKSTAYYQLVSTVTPREAPGCSTSSVCTTSGYVCGYDLRALNNGGQSDYQTSCGQHLAWLSANEIWALNNNPTNAAPFNFNGSYNAAAGNPIQFNQLFTCTAPTVSGYNTSSSDPSLACGCTNWGDASQAAAAGDASFDSQIAAPSTACAANNTEGSDHDWTAYVLPTIAWMKSACPTCYTYPFDDMSSTFQCTNQASSSSGTNSVPYAITFSGDISGH